MKHLLIRFLREDDAQDMVEYAAAALFFGVAGYFVWNQIIGAMNTTYTSWDAAQQNLWNPPAPTGTPLQ
jgi:Flp pilus assembly pilin Flp